MAGLVFIVRSSFAALQGYGFAPPTGRACPFAGTRCALAACTPTLSNQSKPFQQRVHHRHQSPCVADRLCHNRHGDTVAPYVERESS